MLRNISGKLVILGDYKIDSGNSRCGVLPAAKLSFY